LRAFLRSEFLFPALRQLLRRVQTQALTLVETFLGETGDGGLAILFAEAAVGLDARLLLAVGVQPLLPLLTALIECFQARGGFGANQLQTQLADLFRGGTLRLQGRGLLAQLGCSCGTSISCMSSGSVARRRSMASAFCCSFSDWSWRIARRCRVNWL